MAHSTRQLTHPHRIAASSLALLAYATCLHAQALDSQIAEALRLDAGDPAVFAAHVIELPSGAEIYSYRSDAALKPASNMKLVTTAAAIDLLGSDFEFRTAFRWAGDDLLIVGGGDPLIVHPRVESGSVPDRFALLYEWADRLLARGVSDIPGDVIIDDSVFDAEWVNPSWPADQLDKHYCAPVGGLNLHGNCIQAVVYPKSGTGGMAEFVLVPANPFVRIENRCRVAGGGQPWLSRKPGGSEFLLGGSCAEQTTSGLVAVTDPGLFFGTTLRTYLAAKGIRTQGELRRRALSQSAGLPGGAGTVGQLLFVHSTEIDAVLTEANGQSLNLAAECLLKMIGHRVASASGSGPVAGSWASGRAAVIRYLRHLGLDVSGVVIDDGSGLSHDNRLTPEILTGVLNHMFNGPYREQYMNSLARSGESGTLQSRMRDLPGRFLGKTGYIDGVRALSGYLQTDDGGWLALCILHNGFSGSSTKYRQAQEQVCRILTRYETTVHASDLRGTQASTPSSGAQ